MDLNNFHVLGHSKNFKYEQFFYKQRLFKLQKTVNLIRNEL